MMTWKHKLATLLVAGTIFGCSSPPPATPSGTASPVAVNTPAKPALPDGWTEVKSKDGKLKMAVPPNWVVADASNPEFVKVLDDLSKANPGMAKIDPSSFYFMCMDSKQKNKFSDNLNVVKKSVGQTLPFNDETAKQLKDELAKAMPVQGDLEMEITKVPAGEAFRYRAELKIATGAGKSVNSYAIGYMLFQGTDMYIVTFSTTPKDKESYTTTAKQMMETFTIL